MVKNTDQQLFTASLQHSPARTVITRSGSIVRGKFPSFKNRRMVHHEGLLELEACYLFETSPSVVSYREQPIRIQYMDGKRMRVYTPDFELTLKTGEIILVEIKHSAILARAEITEKYRRIDEHMRRVGLAYCIVTEAAIRMEPRLGSMRYAYSRLKRRSPSEAKLENLVNSLAHLTNASLSEVNALTTPYGISAFDLLAGGYLTCDLSRGLSESTQVSVCKESNHEWLRISKEYSF